MGLSKKTIIVIMGVSGCGKSTLGRALANALDIPFIEGDDYHPEANVTKMSRGIPLNDGDRADWLDALRTEAEDHMSEGAVIACSALKESYRKRLSAGMEKRFLWILLDGSYDVILARMRRRTMHFMPASLLQSQFDILEIPDYALSVAVDLPVDEQTEMALAWIKKEGTS